LGGSAPQLQQVLQLPQLQQVLQLPLLQLGMEEVGLEAVRRQPSVTPHSPSSLPLDALDAVRRLSPPNQPLAA
jgi:hypothetical protein